ncbi:4-coumarate--CoA ligase 1 [Ixodes scapularis]|uniref:4-coumarate--CoA ligase 1 n=1 Tax=Ixodes scapularis TaxID=6945 RepID=UPI001C38D73C|nr:4-coumarate--CoA ligase 1 [Ixodes scapularis]
MEHVSNADSPITARIEDGIVYSPLPSFDIPKCSFYAMARELVKNAPEKLMLVDDSHALTRAECLTQMQRYAAGFQAHGIQPGDHVCVHLENSIENYIATFGCVFAGAVIVLATTSLTERELHYQVKEADVVHILTEQKFVQKVKNVDAVTPFKELEFQEIPVPDPERTLMALAYTSGTTGLPKPVEITHYNFVASFYTTAKCGTRTDGDVTLAWNQLAHVSGLWSILTALAGTICVVVPHTLGINRYADMIDKFKVTLLVGFPGRLEKLVHYVHSTGRRLITVQEVGVGGGALSKQLAELTMSVFENLRSLRLFYGMTESNGFVCAPPKDVVSYTDIGYPVLMSEIKVVNVTNGESLGPNEPGELCYRSPTASRGYYKRPLETAQFRDSEGWCRSGDWAYYDADGRVHFVERIKEMIKCLDQQVVPTELEELLLAKHDGIAEVAVLGVPHPVYGEAPAAIVVPKKDIKNVAGAMEREIKDIIAGTCAEYKHLYGGVFFVEALPKTESGKIQRKALFDTWAKCARLPL